MNKAPKWDRHSIKAELHRRGMTMKALAVMEGITPGQFAHVWKRPVRRAENALAKFLGVPAKELFPDRYPIRTAHILSSKYEAQLASQKDRDESDRKAA